jgi:hypothetical protein
MLTIGRPLFALALILPPVGLSVPAGATPLLHTWVSNTGTDSGTCGDPATPCATFGQAYTNTQVGGEITCLNSGNFGIVDLTNSMTIDCQYSMSSNIAAGNGFGNIAINTPAGSIVTLRGLDFDVVTESLGGCTGGGAIVNFIGAGLLHLQKMKINHAGSGSCGIFFGPSGNATLDISDSDITDNGTSGTAAGIYVQPAAGVLANVTITRTQIQGNYFGIVADGTKGGTLRGTISDSVVSGNTQNGITASTSGSGSTVLIVDQTKVSENGNHGLAAAGSGAGMLVRNSSVFSNTGGGLFAESGATLYSYGNNSVNGNNGNDGSFTGTIGLK